MRIKTLLRSGPALWAALVLLPALLWFSARNADTAVEYWASASTQSLVVLGFVSGACGACAAWEAGRLTDAGIENWAPVRPRLRVAAVHLAPVAVLGLVGLLVSLVAFSGPALGTPGHPDFLVLATAYLIVLSHMAVGYLLGCRLPRLISAALMLIVGYFWGFWPAALDSPSWLRHLNGQGVTECCGLDQEPSLRSLGSAAAFSAGLIIVALIVLVMRKSKARLALAWTAGFVGIAAGVAMAHPMGFKGAQARDRSLFQCIGNRPQVCLWPEQRANEADFLRWSHDADRNLRAVGIKPVSRVEFGATIPNRNSVLTAISAGSMPSEPPACAQRPNARYPGDEAVSAVHSWLALTAGAEPSALQRQWPAPAVALGEEVRRLPTEVQKRWFEQNMRAVRDCSVEPDLDPASYARAAGQPT
ncbi:hypothetical protein ACFZB6_11150 [Streptomyces syringium]|uniref:DUF7224 domain-containing protein n=1 Tax=Streptomyces syringium TaxID=76729 RepID=UPI0033A7581D